MACKKTSAKTQAGTRKLFPLFLRAHLHNLGTELPLHCVMYAQQVFSPSLIHKGIPALPSAQPAVLHSHKSPERAHIHTQALPRSGTQARTPPASQKGWCLQVLPTFCSQRDGASVPNSLGGGEGN